MLLKATSASASNDRGIIHQFLTSLGVSSDTAHDVQVIAIGPLKILLILASAFLLTRLVRRGSRRLVGGLRLVSPLVRATPRGEDRARTVAGVLGSVFRAVIWIVAILTILGELNINLVPFVATATVIGAALGFGAQSLVRDFLSGVLILAEDQYGVGDSIVVGETIGTVESVNLRTTRMRALDGVVWYVPNGEIRKVGNNTESDSQAIVDVVVPPGTDLEAAARAAVDAARQTAADPEWRRSIIGDPLFAGVESVDQNGATLRVLARTRPGDHFRVARELRFRVAERLRVEHIAWVSTDPVDS
jgi:small conductance mechanosensitive channel